MASVAARIKELFDVDSLVIMRAVADSGIFTVVFSTGFEADEIRGVQLPQHDRLAKWLLTNERTLMIDLEPSVFNYLTPTERDVLTQIHARVCTPLIALNRLIGLIFISSKQTDWKLSSEDSNLLQMLTSQASIAFENAYLYQQQRDRLRMLYRAERLAVAGQLAASVAHEIRNPLTTIRSTVQYLLKEFDKNSPKRSLVEGVIAEVDRIDQTVNGLLSLTRRTEFRLERIAVSEFIQKLLLLVRTQARDQSVEIIAPDSQSDFYIMGDASHLKQLFLNLILNALQAMPGGGQLEISLSRKPQQRSARAEKCWVQVKLRDTGCGIPSENLDKIFDPFFTTKQGGTGLGLSISYAIARQHGGELEIDSHNDDGTTAMVRLMLVN